MLKAKVVILIFLCFFQLNRLSGNSEDSEQLISLSEASEIKALLLAEIPGLTKGLPDTVLDAVSLLLAVQTQQPEVADHQIKHTEFQTLDLVLWMGLILSMTIGAYLLVKKNRTQRALQKSEQEKEVAEKRTISLQRSLEKEKQEYKQRQLSIKLINTKRKHETLRRLEKILTSLSDQPADPRHAAQLQEAKKIIHKNLLEDESVASFLTHFEHVAPTFFSRVAQHAPNLTVQDKRLLAYLKMNLNSKEIAVLQGVNHNSVNTARYRLRKKLNLTKDESLDQFVAAITGTD